MEESNEENMVVEEQYVEEPMGMEGDMVGNMPEMEMGVLNTEEKINEILGTENNNVQDKINEMLGLQ